MDIQCVCICVCVWGAASTVVYPLYVSHQRAA